MFDTIGKQTLLINVTCKVISAKGEPKFALQYIGSGGSDVEIFDRETFTDKFGSYHDGRIRQLMRLPTEGFLYCKVRDDHGRYEITEPIEEVPTGKIKLSIFAGQYIETTAFADSISKCNFMIKNLIFLQ